ncbi:MAG TPA: ornithine carbamoyltransferase [Aggregatilineales bacterium]|nr:ornithine carbamoyltransferase [Aggregatilineales bacterium]
MRHFLQLEDWSTDEIRGLLNDAVSLKAELKAGGNRPLLRGKILGMIFQKASLRTRTSFEVGMLQLGGQAIYLGPSEIGLGKRESIADVARVLSGYVDGIMARVFDHEHVFELARWSAVPVINGLSDERHPCQAMADMLTIYEHFGYTEGLTLAYIGDGNNVAASLLMACAHLGINFTTATPNDYRISDKVVQAAQPLLARSEITFKQVEQPEEAAQGADILYTDTWISMGQEAEAEQRVRDFQGYQINVDLLKAAKPSAVVMHDLPAYRGKEITDEVADGPQSVIFQQANNRLHAQKAILVKLMSD